MDSLRLEKHLSDDTLAEHKSFLIFPLKDQGGEETEERKSCECRQKDS
jgi:hypothetical protein